MQQGTLNSCLKNFKIQAVEVNPTLWSKSLTLYAPTPQNSQTHSNNSLAFADELCESDHFVGLALKGLSSHLCIDKNKKSSCRFVLCASIAALSSGGIARSK